MTEVALPGRGVARERGDPRIGYALLTASATLFAVNGALSKVLLHERWM